MNNKRERQQKIHQPNKFTKTTASHFWHILLLWYIYTNKHTHTLQMMPKSTEIHLKPHIQRYKLLVFFSHPYEFVQDVNQL